MSEDYKDRTATLIVLGIFLILGGLLCGFFAVVMLFPIMMTDEMLSPAQLVPALLIYVGLAVWAMSMGIGTLRARRWAQQLMLAASWLGLVGGVMAMGMMMYIMPGYFSTGFVPAEMETLFLTLTLIFCAIFYILLPGVGVLLYGNQNVRATVEHRDPGPSWTDPCPIPVLIIVLSLAMMLISPVMMCCMNCVVPFFGVILSGLPGALVLLLLVVICCALIYGTYKMRPMAWWSLLVLLILGYTSNVLTFSQIDLLEYYEALGYTEEMLQSMEQMKGIMEKSMNGVVWLLYALPTLIYLLWVKRYFNKSSQGEEYV